MSKAFYQVDRIDSNIWWFSPVNVLSTRSSCNVKVSIDWLTEEIEKNDEFVQSVDVAAFNKI